MIYIQNGNDFETKKCIGTLQYGQNRSLICNFSDPKIFYGNQEIEIVNILNYSNSADHKYNHLRFELIEIIRKLLDNNKVIADDLNLVRNSLCLLFDSYDKSNIKISNLFRDIVSENPNEAQISKALSRLDWFNKWGRHYLYAVISAHSLEYRCNFKDPGVQNYGGKLFDEYQNAADELFCKMPAPKPNIQQHMHDNNYGYSQNFNNNFNGPASVAADNDDLDMSSFMDRNGPCFSGNSLVRMKDGSRKLVSEICKGDETINGTIECVIKTSVNLPKLVEINGFYISPYHPIQLNGKWLFPITLGAAIPREIIFIYDFILNTRKPVELNGITVATWAHGSNEKVLRHPFYGTEIIVDRLKQHKNWNCGIIELEQSCSNSRDENRLVNTILF